MGRMSREARKSPSTKIILVLAVVAVIVIALTAGKNPSQHPTESTGASGSTDGFDMAYQWCQSHGGLINLVENDTYYTVQGICADRTTSPSFPY